MSVKFDDADLVESKEVAEPGLTSRFGRKGVRRVGKNLMIPRSMFKPEVKRSYNTSFWDQETLDNPTAGASVWSFLASIAQGTGASQRIGNVVQAHKLVIRLVIQGSSSQTSTTAHLAMVRDKEPYAGAPVWTTVFNGIGAASNDAFNVAIPNADKRFRFDYLRTVHVPIEIQAIAWNGSAFTAAIRPEYVELTFNINRRVRYDNANTAPIQGCEYVLFGWSDISANTPKATGSFELFFSDD